MDEPSESSTPVETIETDTDYACFVKAKDKGEPTFTLRAQDRSAAAIVQFWIDLNTIAMGATHPKIKQAREIMNKMHAWPNQKQAD